MLTDLYLVHAARGDENAAESVLGRLKRARSARFRSTHRMSDFGGVLSGNVLEAEEYLRLESALRTGVGCWPRRAWLSG